jgi:hypothetical protein
MADEKAEGEGRREAPPLLTVECRGLVLPTLTNKREHWGAALRRSQAHRGQTKMLTDLAIGRERAKHLLRFTLEQDGLLVRITRVAAKACDHDDGTNTACKHVRDGVADALGVDDGDRRIAWRYVEQRLVKGAVPGALLHIFARAVCDCCGQFMPRRVS